MINESELKSQQIEACNADIVHLHEEIETLLSSLQEKEATAAQLQSDLEKHQQVTSTPEQLFDLLKLTTQITKLEHRLQEAEHKKQQAELEKEATVKEMKTRETLKAQIHAQLGKLWIRFFFYFMCQPHDIVFV